MEKLKYKKPMLEILELESNAIIACSNCNGLTNDMMTNPDVGKQSTSIKRTGFSGNFNEIDDNY